jgi:hypothetical protein
MPLLLTDLKGFEGKTIKDICDSAYHNNADNHCAHFVSHVLDLTFGFTCKNMTGKGTRGVNIRVHEIFPRCPKVGKWADRPVTLSPCLAFVTLASNVTVSKKHMDNVPKKHIGIYHSGNIWHYSNLKDKVVMQTPEQFSKHYAGSDVTVFFGELPV